MNKFIDFAKRNPYIIIVLALFITIIMGMGVFKLSITEDREEFLPEEHTSYRVLKEYEDLTGKLITEAIMIEGDDLNSADSFRKIEQLTNEIWTHEELEDYILWIRSYPGFLIPDLEDKVADWRSLPDQELERKIDQLLVKPEIKKATDIYISKDRKGAVITAIINNSLPDSVLQQKTEILHDITNEYNQEFKELALSNTGTISTDQAIKHGIIQDLSILIPLAALFIIVVLYWTFKRFLDTLLPFIVLGLGAIWMIGTMGHLGIPFYANFTIIVPLLLGVGIDYTIHFLNRYYQERSKGKDANTSAMNSIKTVGIAILLTALTTIIGFLSFGISEMPPIKSFGYVAGLGIFYVFLLANTVLPALLVIRDRRKDLNKIQDSSQGEDRIGKFLVGMENIIFTNSKMFLFGAVFLAILALFPMMNLSTTMSSKIMMPRGAEAVETQNALEDYFRGYGSDSKAMILAEGDISRPETLKKIEEFQRAIISSPRNKDLIMGTTSLVDLVKKANKGQIPNDKEELSKILKGFELDPDPKYGKIILSENKTAINISFETDTMEEEREATEIIREEIKKLAEGNNNSINFMNGSEPAVSGMPVIFSDISASIKPDLRDAILLAIILVILVLIILFKSTLLGFIGAVPISLTLLWELGLLGILGIPLNVMNMLVSSIAIGIGVDFTIHITHRFKEEWIKNGQAPKKAISKAFQSTGRAILSAAITTIGVFVIIAFSRS